MAESILVVEGVTKTYPGVKALDNVSLEFRKGEIHALVGENGAGKSTIIKTIAGAIKPDCGSVLFEGKDLTKMKTSEIRGCGVEVVYQEFNLALQLPVYENIFIGNLAGKGPGKKLADKGYMIQTTQKLFDQLGIKIDPEARVDSLSVAYMQFVEIAKAVSRNVRILIMDEPTATLTNAEVEILFQTIRKLKEDGVTVIYVSHRMEEIFELTDRCSVLRDGQYIATVNTKETTRRELIHYMVGREVNETYPKRSSVIGEEVLRVEHLTGNTVADVSFTLHKGEILGFGGLVGAGRTETVEMLFGAARVESGDIYLHGRKTKIKNPRDAVKKGIALIPEDRKRHGLILSKNIMENATLPMMKSFAHGIVLNRKAQEKATQEQIDALGIKTPGMEQLVRNLSGGNQQKVILGRWLLTEPDVLLLDEPTRGIDVGAKYEIYKLINDLAARGKTVLMVSSEMPELLGVCDRILVMSGGRLAGETNAKTATQEEIMALAAKYV